MKKILSILVLLGIYLGVSAQGVNKVAIVSIFSTEDLSKNLGNQGAVGYVADMTKKTFKSNDALQDFHNYIFSDLVNEFPFEFISEDQVINNEVYKEVKKVDDEKLISKFAGAVLEIEGYDKNIFNYKDNFQKYSEAISEANAFLIAKLDVKIVPDKMIGSTGTAVVQVTMHLELYSNDAHSLLQQSVSGTSKGNFKVVANQVVKGGDNIPLYIEQAVQDMYNNVQGRMPSILKAYNKKVKKFYS